MSKFYNHAFTIAFSMETNDRHGSDICGTLLRAAILNRLAELNDAELEEAVGTPYDSYECEVRS